jgi:hypothetical protein
MYAVLAAFPLLFAWLWLTGRRALALVTAVVAIIVATLIDRLLEPIPGPLLDDVLSRTVPIAVVVIVLILVLPQAQRRGWLKDSDVERLFGGRGQTRGQDAHHKQEE